MKPSATWAIIAGLALASAGVGAQIPLKPAAGEYTIGGVVVNERSGQPLPRVSVSLNDTVTQRNLGDSTTDADGNFRFDHLPAGRYALIAQHRGYVPQAFQEHPGGVSTAIVTGEGKSSTGLRFTLRQQASVFGNISEDSGDPVPRARILLFRKEQLGGVEKTVPAGQTTANEAGDYELTRLTPGSYYLCVTGTPWYARRMHIPQAADAPRSTLDVAYAPTCYPGVTDPAQAELLELRAGDRLELPVTMHSEPAVHIVLPLSQDAQRQGVRVPSFRTQIFGTTEFVDPSGLSMQPAGDPRHPTAVWSTSVAPGQYQVALSGQDGRPQSELTLNATTDTVTIDPAAATQRSGVSGTLVSASGLALPQQVAVFLTPVEGIARGAGVLPTGAFKIDELPPGDYRVTVQSSVGRMGVARMTATGAAIHGGVLTVGTDPVTLNLSVFEASATVAGIVQRGNAPASGVFVLLVPEDPHAQPIPNQSDSDGTFEYRHMLPGVYTAVAIEDGWNLDWSSRDVLEHYRAGGQRITISASARVVNVPAPLEAQARDTQAK